MASLAGGARRRAPEQALTELLGTLRATFGFDAASLLRRELPTAGRWKRKSGLHRRPSTLAEAGASCDVGPDAVLALGRRFPVGRRPAGAARRSPPSWRSPPRPGASMVRHHGRARWRRPTSCGRSAAGGVARPAYAVARRSRRRSAASRQRDIDLDRPTRSDEFQTTIEEEADRLTALVGNLLDMSRLQAGRGGRVAARRRAWRRGGAGGPRAASGRPARERGDRRARDPARRCRRTPRCWSGRSPTCSPTQCACRHPAGRSRITAGAVLGPGRHPRRSTTAGHRACRPRAWCSSRSSGSATTAARRWAWGWRSRKGFVEAIGGELTDRRHARRWRHDGGACAWRHDASDARPRPAVSRGRRRAADPQGARHQPRALAATRSTLRRHGRGGARARRAPRTPTSSILDLGLPGIDGVEVIRGLRGWTHLPIVVLSARGRRGRQGGGARRRRRRLRRQAASAWTSCWRGCGPRPAAAQPAEELPEVVTADFTVDRAEQAGARRRGAPVRLHPDGVGPARGAGAPRSGKLVSQRQPLQEVWGPRYGEESNHLRRTRPICSPQARTHPIAAALLASPEPGMGYRFVG